MPTSRQREHGGINFKGDLKVDLRKVKEPELDEIEEKQELDWKDWTEFHHPHYYSYEGQWGNGCRNGYGVSYHEDGFHYEGSYKDDKRSGEGKLSLHNLSKGDGVIDWVYEGEFAEDLRHGKGLLTESSGEMYDGQWVRDRMEGKGQYKWPDGRFYSGDFKNGQKSGYGAMLFPDRAHYEGDWEYDVPHGTGKWIRTSQKTLHDALALIRGREYHGGFKLGLRHGFGTLEIANGMLMSGEWVEDYLDGIYLSQMPKVELLVPESA